MSPRMLLLLAPLLPFALAPTLGIGCGGDVHADATSSASGGSGGSGGSDGGAGAAGGDGGAAGFDPSTSSSGTGGGACWSVALELMPLDMILVLDRSDAMAGAAWTGATDAVGAFVGAPASAGASVGLVYFPADDSGGQDVCNAAAYQPLSVPLGELPAHGQAIVTSLSAQSAGGISPIYGALDGALLGAVAHQSASPERAVVVALASGGDPSGCLAEQEDPAVIAGLAANALASGGVSTYAVAMPGATAADLDLIAAAGGTAQAHDATGSIDALGPALSAVRDAAQPCALVIPPTPGELDPGQDEVQLLLDGEPPVISVLPWAEGPADCGAELAWYFDDNATPTTILLCPAACEQVKALAPDFLLVGGCEPTLP